EPCPSETRPPADQIAATTAIRSDNAWPTANWNKARPHDKANDHKGGSGCSLPTPGHASNLIAPFSPVFDPAGKTLPCPVHASNASALPGAETFVNAKH